ncbi:MAG: cadherin-like beta sandwich domain-containing protein, partial [Chloroflexi bacterium]|nr:cadherin-like beta sandwich domain-containing protein [Chloroflexota bacterium]
IWSSNPNVGVLHIRVNGMLPRDLRPGTSWKGYSLTLSADRVPSEKGGDVIVTLDLGKPAPPNFWAVIEGLPAGTASYGISTEAQKQEKKADARLGVDWTMLGKVQVAGSGGLRPASRGEILRGAERGVVAGPGGSGRLQQHLRDWNGEQTKTVTLRIIDDPWVDPDETIVLRATGPNIGSDGETPWTTGFGFSELKSNTLTLTINDDDSAAAADAPLEVGVLDAVTYESGSAGTNNAPVTVWLSRPASHDVRVNYATSDGTARSDGTVAAGTLDYAPKSGTVTIPAGETRAEVTVVVFDDVVEDSGEQFLVRLSNPSPSTVRLARAEATVTIRNDEVRLADLAVEGGPGAKGPWSALDIGAFSRDRTDYAVTVPYGTTHAQLRATPVDERATLATGAGSELAAVRPGFWGDAVALDVGDNTLVMTASGNSGEVKTYRVTVTRQAWAPLSDADVRWLLVQGASNGAGPWTKLDIGTVDAATTEYAVTVPHAMTVARIMATPMDEKATHRTGAGGELSAARSGFYSRGFALAVGDNAFAVEVTAEDGTAKTYRVTVTRAAEPQEAVRQEEESAQQQQQKLDPLTAALENVPSEHDGGAAFAIDLRFSEALGGGGVAPSAASFRVQAGSVAGVERVSAG